MLRAARDLSDLPADARHPARMGVLHVPSGGVVINAVAYHAAGPGHDALVTAIKAQGGKRVTAAQVATDHSWSDHRIELETRVIRWLESIVPPKDQASKE